MRVFALSAVEAGHDLIRALAARGVRLDGIIALSAHGNRSEVSGYLDAAPLASLLETEIHYVDGYGLSATEDRRRLEALDIDVLIVAGWQRLIPDWLISHCRLGVLGLHGSARGIHAGRGRSPQNWALITGAEGFEISVFLIDPGVDSGPVLASRRFAYTPYDDIVSSYQKSMLLSATMIAKVVADWDGALSRRAVQEGSTATYLPQRKAEDGAIDWTLDAVSIRRQVAALTRPYPGAFSSRGDHRVMIWGARPLGDLELGKPHQPGEVVHVAGGDRFIVRVGDGYMIVDEFELATDQKPIAVGDVLASVRFEDTIERIIARHQVRYPDQPLSPDVLELAVCRRKS